jgi:L-lactate dehydrogenase complex protein LldF
MATCPVYRRSGGLSYDATYAGPIGLIINPTIDFHKYSSLPFASTLNGSCTNVCPVKINIHEQILAWRKVIAEKGELPTIKAAMMKTAGTILSHPRLYRLAIASSGLALRFLPHFVVYNRLNTWTRGREMPKAPRETFHAWWARNRGRKRSSGAAR